MARPCIAVGLPFVLTVLAFGCATERPAETAASAELPGAAPEGKGSSPRGRGRSGVGVGETHRDSAEETELEATYSGSRALTVLRGKATYYGNALAGHRTASGERYDPQRYTAAHRTLAFGTVVRVLRTDGRCVYVRITDRGPFGDGRRIIDLSVAAAERLGMIRTGVADVRVEVLEYGRRAPRR